MMDLFLSNTLSGKKERFVPIQEGKVSFYLCGVTVYDVCHIGHARAYVAFDTIRRYLTHLGYQVKFIQNFTDIDDKIIKKANEVDLPVNDITSKYIEAYFNDMRALNIKDATAYPHATHYVSQMIEIIEKLIDKGHAYVAGGDVCFSVPSFKDYGKLSKKILEDLIAGSRVDISHSKQNPMDFVLWKSAKPGEPSWPSPWGDGRPGWHIECSAMVLHELGETIDIHAGGADLVFPHHENEIAQSECLTGKPLAKYWLHNGFVTIQSEKMSKSLKNIISIQEILKRVSGDVLRFYLLKAHYKTPLHFSYEGLEEAQNAYQRLVDTIKNNPESNHSQLPEESIQKEVVDLEAKFHKAMCDDFNSAEAIGYLFELTKIINSTGHFHNILKNSGQLLGLFSQSILEDDVFSKEVLQLVEDRAKAKAQKEFEKSDTIRNQLIEVHGVTIEDTPSGSRLKRIRRTTAS